MVFACEGKSEAKGPIVYPPMNTRLLSLPSRKPRNGKRTCVYNARTLNEKSIDPGMVLEIELDPGAKEVPAIAKIPNNMKCFMLWPPSNLALPMNQLCFQTGRT